MCVCVAKWVSSSFSPLFNWKSKKKKEKLAKEKLWEKKEKKSEEISTSQFVNGQTKFQNWKIAERKIFSWWRTEKEREQEKEEKSKKSVSICIETHTVGTSREIVKGERDTPNKIKCHQTCCVRSKLRICEFNHNNTNNNQPMSECTYNESFWLSHIHIHIIIIVVGAATTVATANLEYLINDKWKRMTATRRW